MEGGVAAILISTTTIGVVIVRAPAEVDDFCLGRFKIQNIHIRILRMEEADGSLQISKLAIGSDVLNAGLGLLDLDDFSLCSIINYLGFKDFSSFSKTCKRINSIANDRYSWNSAVLFRRIGFLIQTAWFEGLFEASEARSYKNYPKCVLTKLMRDGVNLGQTLSMLNAKTARHVWEGNGSFATKLFIHLVKYTVEQIHNEPLEDWLIESRNYHFKFESEDLHIQVSVLKSENRAIDIEDGYLEDGGQEASSSSDDDDDGGEGGDDVGWAPIARKEDEYIEKLIALTSTKFKIKAYVSGKCILIYKSDNYEEPHTRKNRDVEDVPIENDLHCFKKISDFMVSKLPETNLPLRPEYLLDLFLHFPNKPEFITVPQLRFLNENENTGHRDAAFSEMLTMHRKGAIEEYHNKAKRYLREDMKKREMCEELVLHLGTLLEKKAILYASVDKCYHASAKAGFDLIFANDDAIRALLRRVDFQASTCDFNEQELRNCILKMRLHDDQVMRVEFTWEKDINPGMADKMTVKFDFYINDTFFHFWETDVLTPSPESLSKVSKITNLFKECLEIDLSTAAEFITNGLIAKFLISIVKGLLKGMRNCSF